MNQPKPRTDRLAESNFEQLCLAAGLTVNRVGDDQNGWDFIVEFPPPRTTGSPDTGPGGLTCLVQVKSSLSKPRCKVKLSNALKFARNQLPCFTVLTTFDKDGVTPTCFYVQHFWKKQIAHALKAVRSAYALGVDELNRRWIAVSFTPDEAIAKERVIDCIAKTMLSHQNYASTKQTFAGEVGYEDGGGKGSISFNYEDIDAFVDMMLGLKEDAPITKFRFHHERFGIPDREALTFDTAGRVKVSAKPVSKCAVIVRRQNHSDQITLDGEIFVPGVPNLPDEFQKVRVRTDVIDFTCQMGPSDIAIKGEFGAALDASTRASIDTLNQTAALWSWLADGTLELEVRCDGKRFLHGNIKTPAPDHPEQWRTLHYVTTCLARFIEPALRPSNMTFTLSDFQSIEQLYIFARLMAGAPPEITGKIHGGVDNIQRFLTPLYVELGQVTFFAVALYRIDSVTVKGDMTSLRLSAPVFDRQSILRGSAAENRKFILSEVTAVEKTVGSDGQVLTIVPDQLS
jgi:hypothetical protein